MELKQAPRLLFATTLVKIMGVRQFRNLGAGSFVERRYLAREMFAAAADEFAAGRGAGDVKPLSGYYGEDDDADSDTPILDWIRDILESGVMQDFLAFLFEAIPKLIAAIVVIFAI